MAWRRRRGAGGGQARHDPRVAGPAEGDDLARDLVVGLGQRARGAGDLDARGRRGEGEPVALDGPAPAEDGPVGAEGAVGAVEVIAEQGGTGGGRLDGKR